MHVFLPRDAHAMHTHRAIYAATGCLSVRLSITKAEADPGFGKGSASQGLGDESPLVAFRDETQKDVWWTLFPL